MQPLSLSGPSGAVSLPESLSELVTVWLALSELVIVWLAPSELDSVGMDSEFDSASLALAVGSVAETVPGVSLSESVFEADAVLSVSVAETAVSVMESDMVELLSVMDIVSLSVSEPPSMLVISTLVQVLFLAASMAHRR